MKIPEWMVHLNQINRYASLIRNFTNEDFQIVTFYGYLIGEGINAKEVRAFDGWLMLFHSV